VLTISDTRTIESDTSGRAIAEALEAAGHEVIGRELVRDEPADVRAAVASHAGDAQVIVTTGGTGITSRDSTYEAIASLLDKRIDGFGELFRSLSYAARAPAPLAAPPCSRCPAPKLPCGWRSTS
jgi:molybdenum cofactor biosynthesis protein B